MVRANYSAEEVRSLIEQYAALLSDADTSRRGLRHVITLADLNKALERLPLEYWEVVLLHGLLGIAQDETARLLQTSQKTVSKRYRLALEEAHYLINGGEF